MGRADLDGARLVGWVLAEYAEPDGPAGRPRRRGRYAVTWTPARTTTVRVICVPGPKWYQAVSPSRTQRVAD